MRASPSEPRPHPCVMDVLTLIQLLCSLARLLPWRREDVGARFPITPYTCTHTPPSTSSRLPSSRCCSLPPPRLLSLAVKGATRISECVSLTVSGRLELLPCPHFADEEIEVLTHLSISLHYAHSETHIPVLSSWCAARCLAVCVSSSQWDRGDGGVAISRFQRRHLRL